MQTAQSISQASHISPGITPSPPEVPSPRYFSYSRYLHETFGGKTYKIVVSSGLTCPTRDGKLAKAGCAFCDIRGSSSFFGKKGRGASVQEQIQKRLPEVKERFTATRFLAYFQSYTNTYSDVEYLREIYEAALSVPEIQGLCIGTRPDCLPDAVLDLLEEIAKKSYVSLELGVQSFEDPTLEWLVRGHDRQCSLDALERLRVRASSVHVCVHLMFGSPTESPSVMKDAALILNQTHVRGVKLHQLMILENTDLAERFKKDPFPVLDLETYAHRVSEFVDHLSPQIYLERLCATATHNDECIAPVWSRQRWEPHNVIRRVMDQNQTMQGRALAT